MTWEFLVLSKLFLIILLFSSHAFLCHFQVPIWEQKKKVRKDGRPPWLSNFLPLTIGKFACCTNFFFIYFYFSLGRLIPTGPFLLMLNRKGSLLSKNVCNDFFNTHTQNVSFLLLRSRIPTKIVKSARRGLDETRNPGTPPNNFLLSSSGFRALKRSLFCYRHPLSNPSRAVFPWIVFKTISR